jgi:hypothetical protein
MVNPVSLLCHAGVLETELNYIINCTATTFNYLLDWYKNIQDYQLLAQVSLLLEGKLF